MSCIWKSVTAAKRLVTNSRMMLETRVSTFFRVCYLQTDALSLGLYKEYTTVRGVARFSLAAVCCSNASLYVWRCDLRLKSLSIVIQRHASSRDCLNSKPNDGSRYLNEMVLNAPSDVRRHDGIQRHV